MMREKISKARLKIISALTIRKFRQKYQLFKLEGEKNVKELISECPAMIDQVLIAPDFQSEFLDNIDNIGIVSAPEMQRISHFSIASPIIAICKMKEYYDLSVPESPISILLDQINDPGNLGTIVRSADWFGVRQIYLLEGSVDVFHPKFLQATMGSFLRVKCSTITKEEVTGLPRPLIGATLSGINHHQLSPPDRSTLVLGSEAHGISPEILSLLDHMIRIDGAAGSRAESLNVAVSTGILLEYLTGQVRSIA